MYIKEAFHYLKIDLDVISHNIIQK